MSQRITIDNFEPNAPDGIAQPLIMPLPPKGNGRPCPKFGTT